MMPHEAVALYSALGSMGVAFNAERVARAVRSGDVLRLRSSLAVVKARKPFSAFLPPQGGNGRAPRSQGRRSALSTSTGGSSPVRPARPVVEGR